MEIVVLIAAREDLIVDIPAKSTLLAMAFKSWVWSSFLVQQKTIWRFEWTDYENRKKLRVEIRSSFS